MAKKAAMVRTDFEGLTNEALSVQLAAIGTEITARLKNFAELAPDSKEIADEALLLVTRTEHVVKNLRMDLIYLSGPLEKCSLYKAAWVSTN